LQTKEKRGKKVGTKYIEKADGQIKTKSKKKE